MNSGDSEAGRLSRRRWLERFLYRHSSGTAAVMVMLMWDFAYFEKESYHLPPLLSWPFAVAQFVVALSYVFFVVLLLCIVGIASALWFCLRGEEPWRAGIWRIALALLSLAVWYGTVGRLEFP